MNIVLQVKYTVAVEAVAVSMKSYQQKALYSLVISKKRIFFNKNEKKSLELLKASKQVFRKKGKMLVFFHLIV